MHLNFTSFDEHFTWRDEPGPRKSKKEELTNSGGWVFDGTTLSIAAPVGSDFWQNTYYSPLLVKDKGPLCVVDVPLSLITDREITMETRMRINPTAQFDQGGLFIRYSSQCWMKAGIEYCDHTIRLSAVVTNGGWSDWSTQIVSHTGPKDLEFGNTAKDLLTPNSAGQIELSLRLTMCRDHAVVFEYSLDPVAKTSLGEGASAASQKWNFVRICRLGSPQEPLEDQNSVQLGPFACCPLAQNGCIVDFTDFHITPGRKVQHKNSLEDH